MSVHLTEMAKARVLVRNGRAEVIGDPLIRSCPLRKSLYGIEEESRESVRHVLQSHIEELGMYGPQRTLELVQMPVSFGASEILTDAMNQGLVDAAVVVCEGAGTVVVSRPEVLQAIGAHMTGLVETEPIPEILQGLIERGCITLDERALDERATIDQKMGFFRAVEAGFRRIAVTIAGGCADDAVALRAIGDGLSVRPFLLAVHTTGISNEQASVLGDCCDLVWSCASKAVRDVLGKRALLQMGVSIPVFAISHEGKRLLLNRALHFPGQLVLHRAGLPLAPKEKQPMPLI